jgi:hypothetical protein
MGVSVPTAVIQSLAGEAVRLVKCGRGVGEIKQPLQGALANNDKARDQAEDQDRRDHKPFAADNRPAIVVPQPAEPTAPRGGLLLVHWDYLRSWLSSGGGLPNYFVFERPPPLALFPSLIHGEPGAKPKGEPGHTLPAKKVIVKPLFGKLRGPAKRNAAGNRDGGVPFSVDRISAGGENSQ